MNTTQNYHYLFDYKKTAQSIAFFVNQTQKTSDNELNQKIQDECPEYHYSQSQDDVVIPIEFILEILGYSKDVAVIIKQELYEQAAIIKSFKDNAIIR